MCEIFPKQEKKLTQKKQTALSYDTQSCVVEAVVEAEFSPLALKIKHSSLIAPNVITSY